MFFHALHYLEFLLLANEEIFNKFKWIGTLSTMTAALIIAVSIDISQQAWPFMIYLIGAFVWTYASYLMKDWALMCLNILFIMTDTYAIIIRL